MKSKLHLLLLIFTITSLKPVLAQPGSKKVLLLIHTDNGGTYELAKEMAKGIEADGSVRAVIKMVGPASLPRVKNAPVATVPELATYDEIAFGSPVYFGNISTAMSGFLAGTTGLWTRHALEGMPATVFMSAGSGAGRELAMQAFWNSLIVHGMILMPSGIKGYEHIDKRIPQGNTVLGTTSLASLKTVERPSKDVRYLAAEQGKSFARLVSALGNGRHTARPEDTVDAKADIAQVLQEKNIILPSVPAPAGNYTPYARSGDLIFINQVALQGGRILHAGKVGRDVSEQQAREATRLTMLDVLHVLKEAAGGDLNRVKRCVQLTGIFNATENYTDHAALMNIASDLVVDIFGAKGKHARATMGAASLPVNSAVEIQAVFELK